MAMRTAGGKMKPPVSLVMCLFVDSPLVRVLLSFAYFFCFFCPRPFPSSDVTVRGVCLTRLCLRLRRLLHLSVFTASHSSPALDLPIIQI